MEKWQLILGTLLGGGGIGGVLMYFAAPGSERLAFRGKDRQDAVSVLQAQVQNEIAKAAVEREEAKGEREAQQHEIAELRDELHTLKNNFATSDLRSQNALNLLSDIVAEYPDVAARYGRQIERLAKPNDPARRGGGARGE